MKKKVKASYNTKIMSKQNYKAFWDEALKLIHEEYKEKGQEDEFKIWFNMEYVEDTLTEITVAVRSNFMWTQMVFMGYVAAVQEKIADLLGQNISITYIVKGRTPAPVSEEKTAQAEEKPAAPTEQPVAQPVPPAPRNALSEEDDLALLAGQRKKAGTKHPQLKEDFTFATFVSGENSAFAYNAALAVAKNPGKAYNPILIYGGVGLGKTHLMQAIGNYIYQERGEQVKICYVSAENFTNEFTSSIRDSTTERFKAKYRKLDVLLLDDIHFLIGKKQTQEELFHTFEALSQSKSQMVFTCDRPITEIKDIEDRLKTRFSSGMSIDLQPPNYETRRAILQKKLDILDKHIAPEVVDYIAKNVQTNVRDLASCLTKMIGYAELLQKPLTIEIAQKELRDTFSQPANGSISIETIQKVVADHYNISLSDIKSKRRNKKFVIPRQIAIYISRQLTDYSFPELGNEFGGRDHTTAMHSYEKVEEQLKIDSNLNSTIQLLMREIKDYRK